MKHITKPLLVLIVTATVLAGCGRRSPTPTPQPTAAQVAPTATTQAQAQATTAPTSTAAAAPTTAAATATTAPVVAGEPEPVDASLWTGLNTVNTYRSRYMVNMAGIQEGQEITQSVQLMMAINREQNASQGSTEILGSAGTVEGDEAGRIEMIRIGEQMWINAGGSWGPLGSSASGDLDDLAPRIQTLLTETAELGRVGVETVNGVEATRYRLDAEMLSEEARADMGDLETFEGDVWVTTGDTPYVVKMQFAATGPAISMGEDKTLDGQIDMLYEVYDINQPITITEPEVGPPTLDGFAEGELPLAADAEIETAGMDVVVYHTSETIADLTTFYREQLTALGWTEVEGGMVTDTFVSMDFTKENITLSASITTGEDNRTQVSLFTSTNESGG